MADAAVPQFDFVDLRDEMSSRDLEQFVTLYLKAFPISSEREDPELWRERLKAGQPAPQPQFHLMIARDSCTGAVAGGLAFEFYRESCCGLLTYVIVDAEYRQRRLARQLVDRAGTILVADAASQQCSLRAIFAETENPMGMGNVPGAASPWERIQILTRLGALRLNIPYVQPALGMGKSRARHLLLLMFPLPGQPEPSVATDATCQFLHEFYRALGVAHPLADPDFVQMSQSVRAPADLLALWPFHLVEQPVLTLPRCSVCLHFVDCNDATELAITSDQYNADVGSMELDLLSLAFQTPAVCNSETVTRGPLPVTIRFPESFRYHSEGRVIELHCSKQHRCVDVSITQTRFADSGQLIWHMAIRPARGLFFSELDIIKLIHLYAGHAENTTLRDTIRFQRTADGPWLSAEELLCHLTQPRHPKAQLKAGTVEIITQELRVGDETHASLLHEASLARERRAGQYADGTHDFRQSFHSAAPAQLGAGSVLRAYCGIVTGIFDYHEIGAEEAMDTLQPIVSEATTFIQFHRSTLSSFTVEDRALDVCWDKVGASPYLFLPHAALLHNEAMLMRADGALERAIQATHASTQQTHWRDGRLLLHLETHMLKAERYLRLSLPNIFNYTTERELFSKGQMGRGSIEQRRATEAKLAELRAIIESRWNFRRERRQMLIALLLAFVSILQLKDGIFASMPRWHAPLRWAVFMAGTGLLLFVIFWLQRGGIRNPARSTSSDS